MDERFIIQLQGKNYVTYEGLLDEAHRMGLNQSRWMLSSFPRRKTT